MSGHLTPACVCHAARAPHAGEERTTPSSLGIGDGSVGKVTVVQTQGPEFGSPIAMEKKPGMAVRSYEADPKNPWSSLPVNLS